MKRNITILPNLTELEQQFEYVNSLIEQHRSSAIAKVNIEALHTNWEVGAYSGDSRSPIPMISVHSVGDLLYRRQS